MSNTRRAKADKGFPAERNLSDAAHRGISISVSTVARAVRIYGRRERELCLWLANLAANSQRVQLCWQRRNIPDPLGTIGRIAEADLARQLGLSPVEIYRALCGDSEADLPRFCAAVEAFREKLMAQRPPLVTTRDSRMVNLAFHAAAEEHKIVTLTGKWRHGKTEEAERLWLENLHRSIWVHCPADSTERGFLNAMATALGISCGSDKKPVKLREQIKGALGFGLIDTVVIDEAHALWPQDLADARPVRVEYVRELCDSLGVGFLLVTTEQFSLSLAIAVKSNLRWAPGQLAGRRMQFELRDTHTDAEIRAIAQLHGPSLPPEALSPLVTFARAEEGYLGAMVNAIRHSMQLARAERGAGASPTLAELAGAMHSLRTSERVEQLASAVSPVTAQAARRSRIRTVRRKVISMQEELAKTYTQEGEAAGA